VKGAMMEYTIEVYKKDARKKEGERLVEKVDVEGPSPAPLEIACSVKYPASKGYRFEIHETWVTKRNLMGGGEFRERYDTPHYCSPSSESYWSM
jgi:hypothetical protein